jgi:hypothetical protein
VPLTLQECVDGLTPEEVTQFNVCQAQIESELVSTYGKSEKPHNWLVVAMMHIVPIVEAKCQHDRLIRLKHRKVY